MPEDKGELEMIDTCLLDDDEDIKSTRVSDAKIAHHSETRVDPELQTVEWILANMLHNANNEIEMLTRGLAEINMNGEVTHDTTCNCDGSTLDTQIECSCEYEDKRDPYDTEHCDPQKQIKLAIDFVYSEEKQKPFKRESEVLSTTKGYQIDTIKTQLVKYFC